MLTIAAALLLGSLPLADLAMAEAQEDFVHAACRPRHLSQVLDHDLATLVRKLGSPIYVVREEARDEIRRRGPAAFRAVLWGRRSTDPEVALWCRNRYDALFACPTCQGTGLCQECRGESYLCRCSVRYECSDCTGSGDVRYEYVNTLDGGIQEFRPRPLFPGEDGRL